MAIIDQGSEVKWETPNYDQKVVTQLSAELSISEVLARLLIRLGFTSAEEAKSFLDPRLADLEDPEEITNLPAVVARIIQAINSGQSIGVVGDYDVDGVTSTTLMVQVLRHFGASPFYFIPRRFTEGYGLSPEMIERVLNHQVPDLLIALDCGTSSIEEVKLLREKNIDVIIIDHHQLGNHQAPEDCLMVNPHVFDGDDRAWSHLCTVGLVFKVVHGLIKQMRKDGVESAFEMRLRSFLDLVSMGTVADLMPLLRENRIFVKYGLPQIVKTNNMGIRALMAVGGLDASVDNIRTSDVSFKIGPRINASGRLADASLPVKMLLSEDESECAQVAQDLEEMNQERQGIERGITKRAEEIIEEKFVSDLGFVVHEEGWHSGVVGVVAGRLCRKFYRPSIVLGRDGDLLKGSGRSCGGIDLIRILSKCDQYLETWGGHPLAAGVSLLPENLEAFRKSFVDAIDQFLPDGNPTQVIEIADWLNLSSINVDLMYELDRLEPFGQANRPPIFGISGISLADKPSKIGKFGDHGRFLLHNSKGENLHVVAWKMGDRLPPARKPIDLAVKLVWNNWRGNKYLQLELVDWRLS